MYIKCSCEHQQSINAPMIKYTHCSSVKSGVVAWRDGSVVGVDQQS